METRAVQEMESAWTVLIGVWIGMSVGGVAVVLGGGVWWGAFKFFTAALLMYVIATYFIWRD